MFPNVDLRACLALPTSQRARMDLVGMGPSVDSEKDRLLNLVSSAKSACSFLVFPRVSRSQCNQGVTKLLLQK